LAYLTRVLKVINDQKVNAIEVLLPCRLNETEPSIRVTEATLIQASDRIHEGSWITISLALTASHQRTRTTIKHQRVNNGTERMLNFDPF